jgi:hypothetical protein
LAPNFRYEKGPSTGLSAAIQAAVLRAFVLFLWSFFKKKAPSSSQKPLAHRLSFPLKSLPRGVIWAVLYHLRFEFHMIKNTCCPLKNVFGIF